MKFDTYHPFRSAKAAAEFKAVYTTWEKEWPVPFQTQLVETPSGSTFVRICGAPDGPPLVLLPGSGSHSLMWIPCIKALSVHFSIYAVDNIVDFGLSVTTRAFTVIADFVNWLETLFVALKLTDRPIHLMGHSFGAFLMFQFALRFPGRVSKMVALAPAATILPFKVSFLLKGIPWMLHPPLAKNFFLWIFKDSLRANDTIRRMTVEGIEYTLLAAKCFKPKPQVMPGVLSDKQLRELNVPTLCLIGENEVIYSAKKAERRIRGLSSHIVTEIIPGAGHDLFLVQSESVTRAAIAFLRQP
jgi:pimeloyl-ACP methyl ester carboxylesterase